MCVNQVVVNSANVRRTFAPGRVNLIGEHTDYNDGFVLPAALTLGTQAVYTARDWPDLIVTSDGRQASISLSTPAPLRRGTWEDYVEGMVRALQRRGFAVGGGTLELSSTVPIGAGLSSSAALEMSVGLALVPDIDRRTLALAGQEAEHLNVGTMCGIMDQFVSAMAQDNSALLIDCRSLEARAVRLPPGLRIVAFDSSVKHALASSEYNARRLECEAEAKRQGLTSLRDATLPQSNRRARHVVGENARVLAFVDALERGDLNAMGRLMAESHASLRDDYEVSCKELEALVAAATPHVIGARMTGGGFGGCIVTLVPEEGLPSLLAAMTAPAYVSVAGPGAHLL